MSLIYAPGLDKIDNRLAGRLTLTQLDSNGIRVDTPLQILTSSQGDPVKGVGDHPAALKYDFHDPAFYNNPYPYYRRMQQEDPLWHNPISGHWVVTRYHDVVEILHSPQCSNYRLDELMKRVPDNRNDEAASLRAALKDRLLFLDGEGHLRIRKLIMHAFSSDSIQRQKPLVAEVVEDVLDHLDPSSPVDLVANATNLVPGRVILHILGFPEEKQPAMKEWTDDVYAWLGTASGTIEERTERAVEAVQRLTEAIRSEVSRVRRSPRSDVLTALVQAEDEGRQLTDDELVANVIGLINAGQETTTCLLANGMLALFTHPEERSRLRAQSELWETAIDEFLRYESPAQFVARRVESPITICGCALDRGAFVSLGLGAANRDPGVFTDPDRLNIGRKEGRILTFGFGPHFCVGSALAHLEASVFFREIETRYPKLQLAVSPVEIEWRHTVSFRSPLTLPVVTR